MEYIELRLTLRSFDLAGEDDSSTKIVAVTGICDLVVAEVVVLMLPLLVIAWFGCNEIRKINEKILQPYFAQCGKIYSHWKKISSNQLSLVKPLLSRNFCERSSVVRENTTSVVKSFTVKLISRNNFQVIQKFHKFHTAVEKRFALTEKLFREINTYTHALTKFL